MPELTCISVKYCRFACLKRLAIISFATRILNVPPLTTFLLTLLLTTLLPSQHSYCQSRLLSETLQKDFKCIKLDALQQMRLIKMWAEGVAK